MKHTLSKSLNISLSMFTFQSYFKDSWNTFDFVTVLGSIVDALMVEFAVRYLERTIKTENCQYSIFGAWRGMPVNLM